MNTTNTTTIITNTNTNQPVTCTEQGFLEHNRKPKLMILGHARHGKDTLAAMYSKQGYRFASSSEFCNELVVFPVLSKKYGYSSLAECYEDRVNHRDEWYDLITAYNLTDKAKLGRMVYAKHDIYCGLRNKHELKAMLDEQLIDAVVFVHRAGYELEPSSSMQITLLDLPADRTWIVHNEQNLQQFEHNALCTLRQIERWFYGEQVNRSKPDKHGC